MGIRVDRSLPSEGFTLLLSSPVTMVSRVEGLDLVLVGGRSRIPHNGGRGGTVLGS